MVFYKIEAIKVGNGEERELSRQEHRARASEFVDEVMIPLQTNL